MDDYVTPYRRVFAAVQLSKIDRVPIVPQITYTTSRISGLKFSEPMFDPNLMADALYRGYDRFEYDGIYVGWESSFNLMAEAMGCKLRIVEDANPSVVNKVVKDRGDIDNLSPPDPEVDGRLPVYIKAVDLLREKVKERVPLFSYVPGPLTLSGVIYGTDNLMLDILRNPDFVHDINRLSARASENFAVAKAAHGVDVVVVAEPTASTSILSRRMFKDFSYPYIRDIIRSIEKAGAIPSLHICGKTDPILKDMVEAGAKILEIDSLVDIKEAKASVGGKVCLMGNLDTTTLLTGEPSDVELDVKDCIEKAAVDGGFILSSGCEVPLNTPIHNIRAMVQAARKYGNYNS